MLSLADKSAILRSVNIFSGAPEEVLKAIAARLEPVLIGAGEVIFQKGDPGDCMYIIVDGRVCVHDSGRVINYLDARHSFGEMAVMDSQPRSAAATAIKQTSLLRLDQALFNELIATHIDIANGVITLLRHFLRARLRDMAEDYEYIQQMERLTAAAAALESGAYQPETIESVTQRTDALGQLARVFQRMAAEVIGREERLRREVQELRIEIDAAKKERQVKELVETDYFRDLQTRVRELRRGKRPDATQAAPQPESGNEEPAGEAPVSAATSEPLLRSPDFDAALKYASRRLQEELSPLLIYHGAAHTLEEVLPAMERLALAEGVSDEELLLLRTAALFHDFGFLDRYRNNEEIGARMAGEVLPQFGYSPEHIATVQKIISATAIPHQPDTLLEQILVDADLDVLGREDFFARNDALRQEMESYFGAVPDEEWYASQLQFLQSHRYYTATARQRHAEAKQRHIDAIIKILDDLRLQADGSANSTLAGEAEADARAHHGGTQHDRPVGLSSD